MAEAQGKIFADERIKTERLMAEEKSKVGGRCLYIYS